MKVTEPRHKDPHAYWLATWLIDHDWKFNGQDRAGKSSFTHEETNTAITLTDREPPASLSQKHITAYLIMESATKEASCRKQTHAPSASSLLKR